MLFLKRDEGIAAHSGPREDEDHDERDDERAVDGLKKAGSPVSIGEAEPQRFGYCTLRRLPAPARTLVEQLPRTERGTVFCLHLNRTGAAEVRRIFAKEQVAAEELAPIFMPNLRLVQIGGVSLARAHGKSQADLGLPDAVEAMKLTVSRETSVGSTHQRMWRLRGTREGDCWEVALAADSKFPHTRRCPREYRLGAGRRASAANSSR